MEVTIAYPILQTGFDPDSVDNTITNYRATRAQLVDGQANAVQTLWQFQEVSYLSQDGETVQDPNDLVFTIRTGSSTVATGSVLGGNLTYIDMWFPPSQKLIVRAKQILADSSATDWTEWTTFTSLGPVNSYQAFQVYRRQGTTSPDVNPEYQYHIPE